MEHVGGGGLHVPSRAAPQPERGRLRATKHECCAKALKRLVNIHRFCDH